MEQVVEPTVRPLMRREYDALIAQGFFEGEPIELIEGRLLVMSPIKAPHWTLVNVLNRLLVERIPADEGFVSVQGPIAASDISEPEPDLYVYDRDEARGELAQRSTLVVEVAESSRRRDLGVKARIYAETGAPEYWVVDIVERSVVVHRDPVNGRYRDITTHTAGVITALRHPAVSVDVPALYRELGDAGEGAAPAAGAGS